MLQYVPAAARFAADLGGLQAQFLFSFAHHQDPENVSFGPLRAFNDFTLAPRTALPLHPHTEVEVVIIALEGTLTYSDAAGNHRDLRTGHALRLTAGTGTQHAEANRGASAAHALELWFQPGQANILPSQEQKRIDLEARSTGWTPVVSGRGDGGGDAVFLNCDASVWWAALPAGASQTYLADDDRQLLLYAVSGALVVNGQPLAAGDHVRLVAESRVVVASPTGGKVLLVDVGA